MDAPNFVVGTWGGGYELKIRAIRTSLDRENLPKHCLQQSPLVVSLLEFLGSFAYWVFGGASRYFCPVSFRWPTPVRLSFFAQKYRYFSLFLLDWEMNFDWCIIYYRCSVIESISSTLHYLNPCDDVVGTRLFQGLLVKEILSLFLNQNLTGFVLRPQSKPPRIILPRLHNTGETTP